MAPGKSRKSREKLADSLMTMSTGMGVALTASLFVAPIGVVLSQQIKGDPIGIMPVITAITPTTYGLFALFYIAAASTVMVGRHSAFKIYDALYPER